MLKFQRTYEAREFTNKAYDLLDEGVINRDWFIICCLKFMSEDDVREMMLINELVEVEE